MTYLSNYRYGKLCFKQYISTLSHVDGADCEAADVALRVGVNTAGRRYVRSRTVVEGFSAGPLSPTCNTPPSPLSITPTALLNSSSPSLHHHTLRPCIVPVSHIPRRPRSLWLIRSRTRCHIRLRYSGIASIPCPLSIVYLRRYTYHGWNSILLCTGFKY